ncbi:unnamed protein product [Aphanomyces euteiches]|uniref:CBM1 domain-containing protein n=1 Tax=Aphanomyces euteiches TaxID=100861 RepID=A0A6G0WBX2_9STRA|nr:hypothetical protein Ae201684_017391 [Aphanomyces euteiches]KAH9088509.1 hypothetical protein Ae201684P_017119 [Aphanomyces euteiches]KAH9132279.1 hypothetical protein AeRB84_021265 [Aphanomyces euteiches]
MFMRWDRAVVLGCVAAMALSSHVHVRDHSKAFDASCTQVSVVGDATYCIAGAICGGKMGACPKKGDVAAADCHSTLKSYVPGANGDECIAPVDAECKPIPSGVLGCVFPANTPRQTASSATPLPTTSAPTTTPASTSLPTTAPATTSKKTAEPTTTPTKPHSIVPSTTNATNSTCSADWSQCGGQSREKAFPNCCASKSFACRAFNVYYSQCLPKD